MLRQLTPSQHLPTSQIPHAFHVRCQRFVLIQARDLHARVVRRQGVFDVIQRRVNNFVVIWQVAAKSVPATIGQHSSHRAATRTGQAVNLRVVQVDEHMMPRLHGMSVRLSALATALEEAAAHETPVHVLVAQCHAAHTLKVEV